MSDCLHHDNEQFFSYPFYAGETVYSCLTPELFKTLLTWLKDNLWEKKNIDDKIMMKLCQEFYQDKTLNRIKAFQDYNTNIIIFGVILVIIFLKILMIR